MNGIELLGATLIHFLWQGILIAAVYAALRRCTTRSEVRYPLASAALAAMAAAPMATWIALRLPSSQAVAAAASVSRHMARLRRLASAASCPPSSLRAMRRFRLSGCPG